MTMTEEISSDVLNEKFQMEISIKTKIVCTYCGDELSFHRSTTSLKYHLRAKHVFANANANSSTSTATQSGSSRVRQTTLAECIQGKSLNKATTAKLTNAIGKCIAMDCRPINIVEDQGLQGIVQKPPSRGTIVAGIHELHGSEKAKKAEKLAQATCFALTEDHWTSVSNRNYLGVMAQVIDYKCCGENGRQAFCQTMR